MHIRPFTQNDLVPCAAILQHEVAKPPISISLTQQQARDLFVDLMQKNAMFVAAEQGSIIGFVVGSCSKAYEGSTVWVSKLYVREDRQGQGIGQKLLDVLIEHYRSLGIEAVELLVHQDTPAVQFYEKQGFRMTEYVKMEKIKGK